MNSFDESIEVVITFAATMKKNEKKRVKFIWKLLPVMLELELPLLFNRAARSDLHF